MELQHVNVKFIVADPEGIDLALLIPVFHGWIQQQVPGELLLDIADYRHVQAGPGVVLIGNEADYSVDNTDGRLGVRYNRKVPLEGSNQVRLGQAAAAALRVCRRLEMEPSLAGKLRFNGTDMELFINDRLMAPNCDATRAAAEPDLREFLGSLFRGGEYSLSFGSDPRRLFSASVKASRPFSAAEMLANLGS